jgi:hypothetical protein
LLIERLQLELGAARERIDLAIAPHYLLADERFETGP